MKTVVTLEIDIDEDETIEELGINYLLYRSDGKIITGDMGASLRPLPEKRILPEDEVAGTNHGEEPWFSDGWNACIDEIAGEIGGNKK